MCELIVAGIMECIKRQCKQEHYMMLQKELTLQGSKECLLTQDNVNCEPEPVLSEKEDEEPS